MLVVTQQSKFTVCLSAVWKEPSYFRIAHSLLYTSKMLLLAPVSLSAFTGVPPNRSATISSKGASGTCHSLTSSCDTSFWQLTSVNETPPWSFGFRTSHCTCTGPVLLSPGRRIRRDHGDQGLLGKTPVTGFSNT